MSTNGYAMQVQDGRDDTPLCIRKSASPEAVNWFTSKVKPTWQRLVAVPQACGEIANANRSAWVVVDNQDHLSTAGKNEAQARITNFYLKQMDGISASAQADCDKLNAALEAPFAPVTDSTALLLQEMRATKAWARCSRVLDSLNPTQSGPIMLAINQIVEDAVAARDTDTLAVLRAELPSWSRTVGLSSSLSADKVNAMVSQAEAPLLSPIQRASRDLEQVAQGGWVRINMAIQAARADIADSGSNYLKGCLLPGFDLGAELEVTTDMIGAEKMIQYSDSGIVSYLKKLGIS